MMSPTSNQNYVHLRPSRLEMQIAKMISEG